MMRLLERQWCRIVSTRSISTGVVGATTLEEEIEVSNNRFRGMVQIAPTTGVDRDQGWGVFAGKAYAKGSTVIEGIARTTLPQKTTHTLQTDWHAHARMECPAHLLNHACDPSVGVKENDKGAFDFVALHDIQAGEEIRFDYETAEWDLVSHFPCSCGCTRCRGTLRGYKHNRERILQLYGGEFIARYLMSKSMD